MNANQAIQENERQVRDLFNSSVELAERKNITVREAIDFKVNVGIKYAKTESQKAAWELRGEQAKEMIKPEKSPEASQKEETHEAERLIVKFHIGRGGRFFNPGHLSFNGIGRIDEGSDFENLFLNDETNEYFRESGSEVGLTVEEAESGVGRIDIDGEYDTTYTVYLSDIDIKELNTIQSSDAWEKKRMIELLCDYYQCEEEDLEFTI